ncbi:MAG: M4 family metallopeptidase [Ferruginibacter sp.]
MKKRYCLLSAFLLLVAAAAFAQPSLSKMKSNLDLPGNLQAKGSQMTMIRASEAGILFSADASLKQDQAAVWLGSQLKLRPGKDALNPDSKTDNTGDLIVSKLHQYYNGIKVEHGVINSTARKGKIAMMQMEFYPIADDFRTTPDLSEQAALQKAKDFTGAKEFMWDGYTGTDPNMMLPKGELVIIQTYLEDGLLCLAYKFNIYTRLPLSRAFIYVDAQDGRIVLNDAIIKHMGVNGSPLESYNGQKQYVDAQDGRIVLNDPIIKHRDENGIPQESYDGLKQRANDHETGAANKSFLLQPQPLRQKGDANLSGVIGTADTHYNNTQQIVTDNASGVPGKPFWLHQFRNGQEITTQNYNSKYPGETLNITNFLDNDNNWTAAEYSNANDDDAALDVHFNMQIISDYWMLVHGRKGWDDNFGQAQSYMHVKEWVVQNDLGYIVAMDNAYWDGQAMYFGDGRNDKPLPPGDENRQFNVLSSLDVSAHEMGHAICQTTAALVYRWESGALNEGFSDIWAACIENYGIINNPSIAPNKSIWKIGEEITIRYQEGLRDMSNPITHGHPSTFKSDFWTPAEFQTCRIPISSGTGHNDDCGVHTNSNVLNKWFFLITQGENGTNTKHMAYSVAGLGFNSSQRIAYLTELNLPPNSSFATCKTVSINAATTLFGASSAEVVSVKAAWVAVGVDTCIYDMSNTPVFATNNFISIGVGANGNIWAGTPYLGLYKYNDTAWVKRAELTNVRINDIKADKKGGIWIAQSGTQGGLAAIAGGVNYFTNPYTTANNFYTVSTQVQVPSRNAHGIYVDTSKLNDGTNPKVWVATQSYLNGGNNTSGMLGQGLYSTYKQFHPVSDSLNIGSGTAGITTVGGNASQVWGFAPANYGGNQILAYNATTNAFLRSYDHNTVSLIPSGFVARAIFFDAMKRAWVGLANGGLMVYDEHQVWHAINFFSLFPAGSGVNPNAITGDPYGDVYIGTTAGLVFFDHGVGQTNRLDSVQYYHLYTNTNGLPSSNINAIAYDTLRFKLLIATDNGITFWEPPCLGTSCNNVRTNLSTQSGSVKSGNWSDPTLWSNNKVPDSLTYVTLTYPVVVDINARCRSLVVKEAGQVNVNPGVKLTIYEEGTGVIYGVRRRQ